MPIDTEPFWKQLAAMRELSLGLRALAQAHRLELRALRQSQSTEYEQLKAAEKRIEELAKERDMWRERHRRLEKKLSALFEKED